VPLQALTLSVFFSAMLLMAAAVFAAVAVQRPRARGIWSWCLACLLLGVGIVLRSFDYALTGGQWFWLCGAFMISAHVLFWFGVRRFVGVTAETPQLLTAFAVVAIVWLPAIQLSYPWQLFLMLLFATSFDLLAVLPLVSLRRMLKRPATRFALAIFVIAALIMAVRAVTVAAQQYGWLLQLPDANSISQYTPAAAFLLGKCFVFLMLLHERQSAELEQLALTDSLTGLLNRKGFLDHGQRVLQRLSQQQGGYALLMMDMDHFKSINDRHGHAAGDAALRAFADILRQQLRPNDCCGRIGGEEFCALLPGLTPADAFQVAERVRRSFTEQPFQTPAGLLYASVSIGVHGQPASPASIETVMQRADSALYEAKALGRNRTQLAVA